MPRTISSQCAHVAERSGARPVQRLGSDERIICPRAPSYVKRRRNSLDLRVTARSIGLNADAITIRPYSGKLEALSKFTVRQPIMQALKNDAKKVFDRAAWAQFDRCMLRYVGTTTATGNFYTNGTTTGTNTSALNTTHLKLIVDYMKERNIAPYVADDYMSIGWPSTFRSIKNTLETLHQYTETGLKMIFNGEIGRYENNRFVEQTNVAKGVTADAGLTGTAWTGGSDWCYFFGEDTVVEGIAVPEEMRAKIPGDYGRSKGVAYYYIGGFGIVHLQAAESRILKWDSLA